MLNFAAALRSTIGRKFLMALTGLVWLGFLCGHLTGNFLLIGGRDAFNGYAQFLTHDLFHGWAVWIADAALLATLLTHAWFGWSIYFKQQESRPGNYEKSGDAKGPSRKSWASQTMPFTGALILAFVAWHVSQFKFGFLVAMKFPDYSLHGTQVRDVYSLVIHAFRDPLTLMLYVGVILLIGFHLSHGAWSAFQSLGLTSSKFMPLIVTVGTLLAVALAIGFLLLPVLAAAGVLGHDAVQPAVLGGIGV